MNFKDNCGDDERDTSFSIFEETLKRKLADIRNYELDISMFRKRNKAFANQTKLVIFVSERNLLCKERKTHIAMQSKCPFFDV